MNKWTLSYAFHLLCSQGFLLATEPAVANDIETLHYSHYENGVNKGWSPTLKLRIAGFFPAAERFKHIYGNSIPNYQLEGGITFFKCYQAWGNISTLYKRGESYRLDYPTTVQIWDFSSGLSVPYKIADNFSVYGGLGAVLGYINLHNRTTCEHRKENKVIGGFVVKSGLLYEINRCYFLDFFMDYLYMSTTFHTRVNVGGLKVGAGVGLKF